ncbi:MAG: hypothetical protein SGJ20_17520 [Planctomycetota bacterium]|nr:hypothetical protein [Planctomycetota bacterium]
MLNPTNQPPRLQFKLRSIFVVMAVLAVLLAIAERFGLAGAIAASFFATLIAAHVVGNALGTHLRADRANLQQPREFQSLPSNFSVESDTQGHRVSYSRTAPASPVARLHQFTPLSRMVPTVVILAAGCGAILGANLSATSVRPTLGGWVVGCLSAAILCGFFGFMVASFLEMALSAWWQATRNHR